MSCAKIVTVSSLVCVALLVSRGEADVFPGSPLEYGINTFRWSKWPPSGRTGLGSVRA